MALDGLPKDVIHSHFMWPQIQHVGVLQFTLYDLMRGVSIAASLALCTLLNSRQGISARKTLLLAAACVPFSVAAARLLNAAEYGATWVNLETEFVRNSGSSIYGALFACFLSALALTRVLHIPTLRFLDAGAPAIAIGEALSRIGCFCAGCCYGEAWNGSWSVVFPGNSFAASDQRRRGLLDVTMTHSLAVHPVQIYGVLLMLLLAGVLIWRFRRPHQDGVIFFLLLIGYGSYRLVIAPFRVEVLPSMKVFSVMFIVLGLLSLAWGLRTRSVA